MTVWENYSLREIRKKWNLFLDSRKKDEYIKQTHPDFIFLIDREELITYLLERTMHKKIEKKAAKALEKDAKHYTKEAAHTKSPIKKKHEMIEKKEAMSAAKDLKKRAKKAHEY